MNNNKNTIQANKKLLPETLLVIAITILLFITFNTLSSVIPLIPAAYLIIEKIIRHRSWSDTGFKVKNIFSDLKSNWHWVLLGSVASPLLTFIIGKFYITGYIDHLTSRLPLAINIIIPAIITITISTFLEEIIFRGFLQGRLELFTTPAISIVISSFIFAFMHYSVGSIAIVILDLLGIFMDSIFYGIIFSKSKNIFASWIGHYLGDLIGVACLLLFVK